MDPMLSADPVALVSFHRADLLAEAERERLAAMLPPRSPGVRHELALACQRLANWLDAPAGYVQLPDSGDEDWVAPWANV